MANRLKPPYFGPKGKSKALNKLGKVRKLQTGPSLNRFTVLWVASNGVPFNTAGFNAALYSGNTLVETARFDPFGVVFFSRVVPLTTTVYTLQLYDNAGRIYRTRTIPAGVEAFAVIG